jgi:D-ribose pyranase
MTRAKAVVMKMRLASLPHNRGRRGKMYNVRILNPQVLSLLARVRHTNTLVIADRGFPHFPQLETIDISLVNDLPTVLQVLAAIRPDFRIDNAYMAREFIEYNTLATQARFARALGDIPFTYEPHAELKRRVPEAIGLIRTGDTTQFANVILVSGPGGQQPVMVNSVASPHNAEIASVS